MNFQKNRWLVILYQLSKISLGIGFILSGIRKLPGLRFTELPVSNPVGLFFEGMHATGYYWHSIGIYQIVVGFLLMTPWYGRLTPLLALPVTVNIFGASLGLRMQGTPVITALMLLANCFIILWHFDAYRPIFRRK